MKVVQINICSNGSTGNLAELIHNRLISKGNESYIFYSFGPDCKNGFFKIGNFFTRNIHYCLAKITGFYGYFSIIPTLNLIKKIKKISPDIIHLHNIHGAFINYPIFFRFLKKYKCHTVFTLHDCWLFTGKCPHFTAAGCYKWKEKCGGCPQLAEYPKSFFVDNTRLMLENKKKWIGELEKVNFVAVSDWLKNTAQQSFLGRYPVSRIYNGIDCETFSPKNADRVREKYKINAEFIILGVASVWDTRKGLRQFIELSNMLSEDEKIVLVGLNEEQKKALPSNIIAVSRTESRDELAEIYSCADVFVNLSVEETFGLTVAEAMACGTPVIVYNSTACPEIVNKDCGYAVTPNDINGVFEKIREIRRKTKTYFSSFCRDNVLRNFTFDKMAGEYLELYRKNLEQ